MHSRIVALLALLALGTAAPALAQTRGSSLISINAAEHAGLTRMWTTHVDLNRGRGRVSGFHLHVSASDTHTAYEVTHAGNRFVFSEHDKNPFGEEIKPEGAKLRAEEKLAELSNLPAAAGPQLATPPTIELHVVPSMTLYATSDDGVLHAIDAETGATRWTASVGKPTFPTSAPAASDAFVGVCNGSSVYVFSAKDGSLAWSRMCIGIPGTGPAVSDELVIVPMVNGQVEYFDVLDPTRPLSLFKSTGRTLVQPVLSFNSVAWPTDEGNLYVGQAHGPGMRFRMQARDSIAAAPAFLLPDKVVATSLDGYVYCLNEIRGNMLWRISTGEPISHAPVALGNQVYAITDRGNLFALDAASGVELWTATSIRSFLAGTPKRLYCMDTRGNLVLLDPATGSRLGTLPASQWDASFMNVQTDRIILASSTGLVQCLRESNQPFPLLHYWLPANKAAVPTKLPTRPAEKTEPSTSPSTDPFGGAADPFAAPGAKPAEAPAAAPAAADPFATP